MAVENTKVPSLPDNSLAMFIVASRPPNKSEASNSSTAYPVFLLWILGFGN